jgi:hypothetical protein
MLALGLGAAPAFGCPSADKIALHVRESSEYGEASEIGRDDLSMLALPKPKPQPEGKPFGTALSGGFMTFDEDQK